MDEKEKDKLEELNAYQEAFDTFDWIHNGKIPTNDSLDNVFSKYVCLANRLLFME